MNIIRGSIPGAITLGLAALVIASCSTATASGSPSASAPAPATASPSPSVDLASSSPSSAPTASPTATPTPPAKPGPAGVAWHKSADAAAPNDSWWSWAGGGQGHSWTNLGDLYLMPVDTQGYEDGPMAGPQLWLSTDLLHWRKASIPHAAGEQISVTAVTRGGPGLVAIGVDSSGDSRIPYTWTSTDGETWTRVQDQDTGLTPGQLWLLRVTAEGMSTFIDGPVDVTEFPGKPFDAIQLPRVIVSQGRATAFVSHSETRDPIELWQTGGTQGWRKIGTLPGSAGGSVFSATQGPRGYVVLGCAADCTSPGGWTSTDGVTWRSSKVATLDSVSSIVAVDAGFIAVGHRVTGTGCVVAESQIYGETWTSTDGRTWRKMKDESQFNHASIYVLIPRGRTLFGLGIRWSKDHAFSTAWTASLPADSFSSGPASTPAPAPGATSGCGD